MKDNELDDTVKKILVIIDRPEYNNAETISKFLLDLIKGYGVTLDRIEQSLRRLNSRVYLIGLPLYVYNTGKINFILFDSDVKVTKENKFKASLFGSEKNYDYALYICLNGFSEVVQLLQSLDVAMDDTDMSSKNTGFLCIA